MSTWLVNTMSNTSAGRVYIITSPWNIQILNAWYYVYECQCHTFPHSSLSGQGSETSVWWEQVWEGGGMCQWHLRYHLWWLLGQQRCQCGVQTAGILPIWYEQETQYSTSHKKTWRTSGGSHCRWLNAAHVSLPRSFLFCTSRRMQKKVAGLPPASSRRRLTAPPASSHVYSTTVCFSAILRSIHSASDCKPDQNETRCEGLLACTSSVLRCYIHGLISAYAYFQNCKVICA